jgi:hypothetical protein
MIKAKEILEIVNRPSDRLVEVFNDFAAAALRFAAIGRGMVREK